MAINVGSGDRVLRVIAGVALIVFGALNHGLMRWFAALGLGLVITALIRFCPAYWVSKINTLGKRRAASV